MVKSIKQGGKSKYKTPTAAQFNRMSRKNKRVAIARDVLEQLKIGRYQATQGTYFRFKDDKHSSCVEIKDRRGRHSRYVDLNRSTLNAQPFLTGVTDTKVLCEVCAKGAAVCSLTRIVNKRKFKDLSSEDPEIIKIFGDLMWAEMEAMFEGESLVDMMHTSYYECFSNGEELYGDDADLLTAKEKAVIKAKVQFTEDNLYRREDTTMEDIMKNIIRNKGRLKTQHGTFIE